MHIHIYKWHTHLYCLFFWNGDISLYKYACVLCRGNLNAFLTLIFIPLDGSFCRFVCD